MSEVKLLLSDLITDETQKNLTSVLVTFYFTNHQYNDRKAYVDDLANTLYDITNKYLEQKHTSLSKGSRFEGWVCDQFEEFRSLFINVHRSVQNNEDASAIQVGISTILAPLAGWPKLKEIISKIISPWKYYIENNTPGSHTDLLGYSISYNSNIDIGQTKCNALDDEILELAQPLFNNSLSYNLAHQNNIDGSLFLLNVPQKPGFESCVIYFVAGLIKTRDSFIYNNLFLNNGNFLTLDTYVHKACFQFFQFTNDNFQAYTELLGRLEKETEAILDSISESAVNKKTENQIKDTANILKQLVVPHSKYKRLRLSIHIQKKNLEFKFGSNSTADKSQDNIHAYWTNFISNLEQNAQLTQERGEIIFEQAKTVIALIEAQQNKVVANQSQKVQFYLTVLGLGIAYLAIFDNDAASGLLKQLNVQAIKEQKNNFQWHTILLAKLIVGIIITVIIMLIFPQRQKRRKK